MIYSNIVLLNFDSFIVVILIILILLFLFFLIFKKDIIIEKIIYDF